MFGGDVGVHELVIVLVEQLFLLRGRILGLLDRAAADDRNRAGRAHHGDLRDRPCIDHIRAGALAVHGDVRAAVGLSHDQAHLRHGRLTVGKEHLRAVADDPAVLLLAARQEGRHIDQRQDGNVEAVAEADEPRALVGGVDLQRARHKAALVGHDANGLAREPGKADHQVPGKSSLHFEEAPFVREGFDHAAHIVGPARIHRHDVGQLHALILLPSGHRHGLLLIVLGQIAQEAAHPVEAREIVLIHEVGHTRE